MGDCSKCAKVTACRATDCFSFRFKMALEWEAKMKAMPFFLLLAAVDASDGEKVDSLKEMEMLTIGYSKDGVFLPEGQISPREMFSRLYGSVFLLARMGRVDLLSLYHTGLTMMLTKIIPTGGAALAAAGFDLAMAVYEMLVVPPFHENLKKVMLAMDLEPVVNEFPWLEHNNCSFINAEEATVKLKGFMGEHKRVPTREEAIELLGDLGSLAGFVALDSREPFPPTSAEYDLASMPVTGTVQ